jgi:hypothetical protein
LFKGLSFVLTLDALFLRALPRLLFRAPGFFFGAPPRLVLRTLSRLTGRVGNTGITGFYARTIGRSDSVDCGGGNQHIQADDEQTGCNCHAEQTHRFSPEEPT